MSVVEHLPRAVQLHPHRGELDLAKLRDFSGRHFFLFKKHEHGPVLLGQVVEHPIEVQTGLLLL